MVTSVFKSCAFPLIGTVCLLGNSLLFCLTAHVTEVDRGGSALPACLPARTVTLLVWMMNRVSQRCNWVI